jgi:serine/threonine-protein kinase RIO1
MEVLQKMLTNAKINKFEGCISTGKEANVYYATG